MGKNLAGQGKARKGVRYIGLEYSELKSCEHHGLNRNYKIRAESCHLVLEQ